MATYELMSDAGDTWKFKVDSQQRITDALGSWPEGRDELMFEGPLPFEPTLSHLSESLPDLRLADGDDVCYHSDHPCMTCFCAGDRMRCVKMC